MSTLSRYLNRMLLLRLAIVAFAALGFATIIDLLDVGDDLVKAPGGPLWAGLDYLGLRLPMMLSELLPLTALIAAIIGVGDLLRHRELVVVWGSGLSNLGVLRLLLPLAMLLLVGRLALDEFAVPASAARLRAWGIGDYKHLPSGSDPGVSYWLSSGDDILRISANGASAGLLVDVTLFRRNPAGILLERVDAPRAEATPTGLRLLDGVRRVLGTRRAEPVETYDWEQRIDLERLRLIATPPRELGTPKLIEILRAGAYGMRAPAPYLTALHTRLAGACVAPLLVCLAFALARRFTRTATIAPILILGVTIGFLAIITGGITAALGEVGVMPPLLAAWAPAVLLAVLVLSLAAGGQRRMR